jgi:hypothetical protein
MREIYTQIGQLRGWLMLLAACAATATGLHAQVGLVWASSDYGVNETMASSKQEITLDLARSGDYIYALVGQADALDGDFTQLYLYKYHISGPSTTYPVSRFKLTENSSTIKFPLLSTSCGDGKSFTPPRKFHLEILGSNIYVAGTIRGNAGEFFPLSGGTTPLNPRPALPRSNIPTLFVARYNIIVNTTTQDSDLTLLSYAFITPQNGEPSTETQAISVITDMDVDATTNNVYLLGYHRESPECDLTIFYEPPPIEYVPIEYEPISPCCRTIDPFSPVIQLRPDSIIVDTTTSTQGQGQAFGGSTKSSATLRLNFGIYGAVGSNAPYTTTVTLGSMNPRSAAPYNCPTTNNFGEINFWMAYSQNLTTIETNPVSILDTVGVGGTILANALSVTETHVYVGGHFSRPEYGCNNTPTTTNLNTLFTLDTFFLPYIVKANTTVDTFRYAQNAFWAKYNKNAQGSLITEQRILSSANGSIQDILVKNDKIYALYQVSKNQAFGGVNARDTVFFKNLSSSPTSVSSFYDFDYQGSPSFNYKVGTQIRNGLYLLQISNGTTLLNKEARIERYQEISTLNPATPFTMCDNLQLDVDDNIYVAMVYAGNLDTRASSRIGATNGANTPSGYISNIVSSSGRTDIAILKYNSDWSFAWARSIGGSLSEGMPSLIYNQDDGIYVGGAFQGLTDFEPSPTKTFNLASKGIHDAFLAKYGCYDLSVNVTSPVCEGSPVTLTSIVNCPGGNCDIQYTWADPSTNGQFFAGRQYVFLPQVGTNVRTVVANDVSTGCIMYDTIAVLANQQVVVETQPVTAQVCVGTSIVFSVSSNLPNTQYRWYYSNSSTPIDTSSTVFAANPGLYRVEGIVNGCKSSATSLLNQYNRQTPQILPDTALLCGNEISLEISGCPGCSFNWSPPLGANVTSATNQIQATVPGTYVANIIDNNGCTYLLNKQVTTAPYLLPSISSRNTNGDYVQAICNNSPLIVETLPFCPTCTYQWSNGSTSNFTFAFTTSNYRVTVTNNANGCSGVSNILPISNISLAIPTITTIPPKICTDQSITTPAELQVSNACAGCFYRWYTNSNTNNTIIGTGLSIPISTTGDYLVRVTDTLNCSEYSAVVLVDSQIVSIPEVSTNHQRLCGSNSATLSTSSCIGCSYQWYSQDNTTLSIIVGAQANEHTVLQAGTYFVEVTYSSGCKRFSEPIVIRSDAFTVSLVNTVGRPKFVCNGSPVLLNISGAYDLPPSWEYQWFRNGVAIPNATGYNYNTVQSGYYTLRVTDQDGCIAVSNIDTVFSASAGANPVLTADPPVLCFGQNTTLTVVTNPCSTCVYGWRLDNNALEAYTSVSTYSTSNQRGYYAVVIDSSTGCFYLSNVVQIRDTSLPVPTLTALNNPTCSPFGVGVILSTPAQSGVEYIWRYGGDSTITTQNTFVVTVTSYSGPYNVKIRKDGCLSAASNDVPVSFSLFNAQIFTNSSPIICNNANVLLFVTPRQDTFLPPTNGNVCPNCVYEWFNNGVRLNTANISTYTATGAGDYFAVVEGGGCRDTTDVITISQANIIANLQTSTTQDTVNETAFVCGPTNSTRMYVNSCAGCTYAWYYGVNSYATANLVSTQTDTSYTVIGEASAGFYRVEINNNGCIQTDRVQLLPTPPFFDTIATLPIHGNICAGTPVSLTSLVTAATYRWMLNGLPIAGILAEQASYQTNIAGVYNLISTDSRGCIDTTDAVTLIASNPALGFALNFNPINPVPITTPVISLDNYLQPISIHNGRGRYTSLTATAAIDTALNTFNPSVAGAGLHIVTYHDTVGACVFSVSDSIEILQATNVGIQNRRLQALAASCPPSGCPSFEACLTDSMRVILTNFPFVPNSVQFLTDTGYISISVTPVLNPVGSVWSGYIPVNVPANARTGKLRLSTATDLYQTGFFLVVQNPSVSMDLAGVGQPLCSNNPIANLTAVPVSGATGNGTFSAAYAATPTVVDSSLLSSMANYNPTTNPVNIVVPNIMGYDLMGRQDLVLTYSFQPVYTGTAITCPNTLKDTMHIQVRNVNLDSIRYTPISITQANESMFNLTRLVYPLASRAFAGSYTGTYINANSVLPVTISAGWGPQPVTYHITNSTCANSVVDTVRVLSRPTLDVIPTYVCRKIADTIWIGRNATGPYIAQNNGPLTQFDPQYAYQNNVVSTPLYGYVEHVNSMTLSSSAGGLIPFNNGNGQERYAFVPSTIAGTSTVLTLTYRYRRITNYFDPTSAIDPSDTANYIIAQIQRTVNFEDLPAVLINPAILADPVFCKENIFTQFSGTPNGGQYYVYNSTNTNIRATGPARTIDTLQNNLFNPQDYLTPTAVNNLQLRYVFAGNACKDSAQTTIGIAAPFNITLTTASAPDFCQEEPNANISISHNIQAPNALDSASGLFYVGGVQSGQIFSPSLRGPGTYPVSYVVSDIYGCQATDTTTFRVFATPILTMSAIAPIYCANDPVIPISLFSNSVDITAAYAANTVTLRGNGVINGGISMTSPSGAPAYYPLQATNNLRNVTRRDTITYTVRDVNGCTATITRNLLIRELPILALTLFGGEAIPSSYCEGDTARIIGSPIGGVFANVATVPAAYPFSLNPSTGFFSPTIAGPTPNAITEEYLYTFANNATGCRDTIRDTITILNRPEVTITGLPSLACASNTSYPLGIISAGPAVTAGVFSGFPSRAVRMVSSSVPSALFYPDSAGVTSTQLTIPVRLVYSAANGCSSRADTSIVLNPLPQLSFNNPGDTLAGGGIDRRFHICESADSVRLFGYNFYNGNNLPIFPETGRFTARGARRIMTGPTDSVYIYFPRDAVFGPDTIVYQYTDPRGCTNITRQVVVVDTVPALGFAGFSPARQVASNPDRFTYCANDASQLIVPSPFGGMLYFQQQLQPNGIYNFNPPSLATPTATTYELSYTYIARRYTNGRVCQDSVKTYVEVKPIPILNFVGIPAQICVSSAADQFTLRATPVGGMFVDFTPNIVGGILADTIFDPFAQFGRRNISYSYTDPATNCSDTIEHDIDVYRVPTVDFATGGGCEGDPITLIPSSTSLVSTPPAADSITRYIWNYGNGIIDTINVVTNDTVIPNRIYAYPVAGIYFPQLTVVNRQICADSQQVRVVVSPKVAVTPALPYKEDFTASAGNWFQETVNNPDPLDSLFAWGWATGSRITTAQVENNVWTTRPAGAYQPADRGWVYSPCFDISTLRRPMFAMDAWTDTRPGVDGATVEFFHPTKGWTLLGERYKGVNWYDSLYLISAPGMQLDSTQYAPLGWSGENLDGFESVRYRLDVNTRNGDLRGMNNVRFRVAFAAADNTDANGREGFSFDNVYIGERGRSVLVEHFTNQNITGIAALENRLYQLIYSNLYGRDVTLLQYQTNIGQSDFYYTQAQDEANARTLYYGISETAKKVRINGLDLVSFTDSLVNVTRYQEYLDMQMLQTPSFKITIPAVPQVFQVATGASTGNAVALIEVEALKDMPFDEYRVHVVITEDSLRSTQRHNMMSVVRTMQTDISSFIDGTAGTPFDRSFAAGDIVPVSINWEFQTNTYRRGNLRINVFVQSEGGKEVYQVATSRDLTVFNGPVNVEELPMAEGKEIIDFKLYPNPAQDYFNVEFNQPLEGEYDWQVVDMLGRVLQQGKAQPGDRMIQVQTEQYAGGMYIFSIHNETVYSQRQAIIARP